MPSNKVKDYAAMRLSRHSLSLSSLFFDFRGHPRLFLGKPDTSLDKISPERLSIASFFGGNLKEEQKLVERKGEK